MRYYIGIDNSSLDHKVRVIDENGNQKLSFTVANTLEGFEQLNSKLNGLTNVHIGFELPHGPLVDYLHSKQYHIYSLNPLKIKRFKESLKVSGNKNNDIDAGAIAEYLRRNSAFAKEVTYNSSTIERLKTLSIIHTRLTHDHARHVNKLRFAIRQYFPIHDRLFSDFGCKTQLKMLLKYQNFSSLQAASDEDIIKFLKDHNYRRHDYISRLISKIRNYNQLISPDVEYAYQFEADFLCKIILLLATSQKRIEKEMQKITGEHPLGRHFRSLPGAGKILSCKLLALFGDNKDRFIDYNSAQCLFGTAPKNYQSGLYHKVTMRKACNKSGRAVLFEFAFSSLKYSSWSRKYYDDQRSRGKTHSVAVRALSNKWVKIIFAIWKNETYYQESKIFSSVA